MLKHGYCLHITRKSAVPWTRKQTLYALWLSCGAASPLPSHPPPPRTQPQIQSLLAHTAPGTGNTSSGLQIDRAAFCYFSFNIHSVFFFFPYIPLPKPLGWKWWAFSVKFHLGGRRVVYRRENGLWWVGGEVPNGPLTRSKGCSTLDGLSGRNPAPIIFGPFIKRRILI
jgi:hypothetical protein